MQIGVITIDGYSVGVVSLTEGENPDVLTPPMPVDGPIDGHGLGERGGREHGGDHRHGRPHPHHGAAQDRRETPEEHRHNSIRYGHHHQPGESHDSVTGNIPYSSSGNPFDRSRFAKELEQKPWLKEKMKHISLGENQDPRANLAVVETMMNRAVVRGTSLESQVKRHRSSGVDEGGYYAGWAAHYSDDKANMFERNLGEALGTSGKGQSNISNYATDNSSGDLAAREKATGAFAHHKTINGESFFSPGSAEPNLHDRWQQLNRRATDFEKSKPVAETPAMPDNLFAGSKAKPYDFSYPDKGTPEWGQKDWNDMHHSGNIEDRRKADQSTKGMSKRDMLVNKFVGEYDTLKRADAIKQSPSTLSSDLGIENLLPDEDLAEAEKINPDKAP